MRQQRFRNTRSSDEKNRETFGDDLVDESNRERERERRERQQQQGPQGFSNGYQRQDSARSDLMPGQVRMERI